MERLLSWLAMLSKFDHQVYYKKKLQLEIKLYSSLKVKNIKFPFVISSTQIFKILIKYYSF